IAGATQGRTVAAAGRSHSRQYRPRTGALAGTAGRRAAARPAATVGRRRRIGHHPASATGPKLSKPGTAHGRRSRHLFGTLLRGVRTTAHTAVVGLRQWSCGWSVAATPAGTKRQPRTQRRSMGYA